MIMIRSCAWSLFADKNVVCALSASLSHTHTLSSLWFSSPIPARAGMCSNMLFTYPLQKRPGSQHWTGGTAQTQQTSTQCVNICSTDWLSDTDSSVYISAWSKPELIIVYTLSWNRLGDSTHVKITSVVGFLRLYILGHEYVNSIVNGGFLFTFTQAGQQR